MANQHEFMTEEERQERRRDPWFIDPNNPATDDDAHSLFTLSSNGSTVSDDDVRTDYGLKRALDGVTAAKDVPIAERAAKDQVYLDDLNHRHKVLANEIKNSAEAKAKAIKARDTQIDSTMSDRLNYDYYRTCTALSYAEKEYNIFVGEIKDLHDQPHTSRLTMYHETTLPRTNAFNARRENADLDVEKHDPDPRTAEIAMLKDQLKSALNGVRTNLKAFDWAEGEREEYRLKWQDLRTQLAKTETLLKAEVQLQMDEKNQVATAFYFLEQDYVELSREYKEAQTTLQQLRSNIAEHVLKSFQAGQSPNTTAETCSIRRSSKRIDEADRGSASPTASNAGSANSAATDRTVMYHPANNSDGKTDTATNIMPVATPDKDHNATGGDPIVRDYAADEPAPRFTTFQPPIPGSGDSSPTRHTSQTSFGNDFCHISNIAPELPAVEIPARSITASDSAADFDAHHEGDGAPDFLKDVANTAEASGSVDRESASDDLKNIANTAEATKAVEGTEGEQCKWHEPGTCEVLSPVTPPSQNKGKFCRVVSAAEKK
ncbi:hypothetical protein LTR62_006197 [Meristemomyces frigidus]|uniref:Uncharacterized protein n=1 Tax=Meristemomyces frigidus TaxID=1508187 RepID=A0AAN7TCU6_9PEZI|nr:hypothetical protein LTR62_006197 [Meristemomyces frigidus]